MSHALLTICHMLLACLHCCTLLPWAYAAADAEARLVAAAQGMATAVLPDCTEKLAGPLLALEQSTMAARRSQGLRIYWRVLEALVAAESARTDAGPPAAAALLAAPLFHRCVAACSFECVLSSYHMANLAFPAVLERLHLPAFDLCKAVEPFVHQLPSLPRWVPLPLLLAPNSTCACSEMTAVSF